MDDLISRQAALAEIDKNRQAILSLGMTGAEDILVHYGRRVIEELPTIDAVPVVRCKECKYYEEWEKDGDCYCIRFSADPYEYLPMEDDDFCSKGKRSER